MANSIQKLGMSHIKELKKEARHMWEDYDRVPCMWYDCVEAVLEKHRLSLQELFLHGDYTDQSMDRRHPEEIRLELEAENLQKIKDAEYVFNADSDE